jgi:orotidine-5'-phosphate decarboxylase
MTDFHALMATRQKKLGHALCVGLDPEISNMPEDFYDSEYLHESVLAWMQHVVDATADHATCFKPQLAYYEALSWQGVRSLSKLMEYIRHNHPSVPIILDGKRGDIDRTQKQYRKAMFDAFGTTATNVSPYMGRDPLVDMHDAEHPERGIITLVYTSNEGAREFQDAIVEDSLTGDRMPIWMFQAKLSLKWAAEVGIKNLGFVMAAAHNKDGRIYSDHLSRCREVDEGKVQYLVPGFGAQGGYVEASIKAGWTGWGSMYLSASSSICKAHDPGAEAKKLAGQIGDAIAHHPVTI